MFKDFKKTKQTKKPQNFSDGKNFTFLNYFFFLNV